MSSKTDIVRMWHEKAWSYPPASIIESNEMYLSESYQSFDKEGNFMGNKAMMTASGQLLTKAFDGFKSVLHDLKEEEDGSVTMSFHFEGTHTSDLDLSAMGMGVFPASGKSVKTPVSKTKFFVEGGQIVRSQAISGGFALVLAAIGALPPA
jgi:hypothetical protein